MRLSSNTYFSVKSKLLIDHAFEKSEQGVLKDIVHLQIYSRENNESIKLQINTFKMRQICAALSDATKGSQSSLILYTGTDNNKKEFSIGRDNSGIYLNFSCAGNKISHLFNIYEARAFLGTHISLCEHFNILFAKTQQKLFS